MSLAYTLVRGAITRVYDRFVHTPPVLEMADYFPQSQLFIDAWRTLRAEALAVAGDLAQVPQFHELMPEQYPLSGHGNREWRMFVLRAYGLDINDNMARCPRLAELVRANPTIKSASLSFLAPGKVVPIHTGPFRGVTRFYLGLKVPAAADGGPGVTLSIADQAYRLGDGDALLWDDTYPHSVNNDTDEWRIALLMDVYRAHMPAPLRAFTNSIVALARLSIRWRGVFPGKLPRSLSDSR
ncbi:MAG: aspartyl/asparaginyl beta-hydroxylase domain-containing protein [Pseudohongiellaceae bacterium]